MSITSASTVMSIRTTGVAPVKPTATDLAAWTEVTLPTTTAASQTSGFYTGLFGYDLTSFFAYCVTATTNCDSTAYNATYFDGWSIGGNIVLTTYTSAN